MKAKCPHCKRFLVEIDPNSSLNQLLHPQCLQNATGDKNTKKNRKIL